MSQKNLTLPFTWQLYSNKLKRKICNPRSVGFFSTEEAKSRGMHLAIGGSGSIPEGNQIEFYWLVDPSDGVITDAKFQAYGQTALIGAAEGACEVVIGKNYDQAGRIGANIIDKQMRDKDDRQAFPEEVSSHLNLIIDAIDEATKECSEIPLPQSYVAPPAPTSSETLAVGGYPGWKELDKEKKIAVIEEVIKNDIRPYIELDAGGIEILDLINEKELLIAYTGACTSCYSAIGATLGYIQETLRNKVEPSLVVVPDLENMEL